MYFLNQNVIVKRPVVKIKAGNHLHTYSSSPKDAGRHYRWDK
jgi:hypothetical protein